MNIPANLLKEAIEDAKARRCTELACACGSVSANDEMPIERPSDEELEKMIEEFVKEIPE